MFVKSGNEGSRQEIEIPDVDPTTFNVFLKVSQWQQDPIAV